MIKVKVQTTLKSSNAKKLREVLKRSKGAYVTVGIHSDAGAYEDGTPVFKVALWNEFGTKTAPERSFFRSTLHEKTEQINRWREEAIQNILEKGWTPERALEMLGFRVKVLIQNKIKSNVPPPNAPSTIAAKQHAGVSPKSGFKAGFEGRTSTLINSGLMLRSVGYKVFAK